MLLVTSWGIREGRTSVAANLAAALAHAGVTVILVDADLRRPSLDTVFETGEPARLDRSACRTGVHRGRGGSDRGAWAQAGDGRHC